MPDKITVVDYGMGNLRSVQKKFEQLGIPVVISGDPQAVSDSDRLILPGVGHFSKGVENLKARGLWEVIDHKVMHQNTPIMGICLGMQLMASFSEEGNAKGFGWFDADVVRFKVSDTLRYKVPHMGWNQSVPVKENVFTKGISKEALYYFVHSYHLVCKDANDVLGETEYDYRFTSMISKNRIFGVQFHPEKSHEAGDPLFHNFLTC
jgi:glutamine amidotransferase